MGPLAPGRAAPGIPGLTPHQGLRAIVFYKVTCPVCHLAAAPIQTIERAYPGTLLGIGQDPPDQLRGFAGQYGWTFDSMSDAPPYDVSNAYGIRTVPTTFLVGADGTILQTVEAWDRAGLNDLSWRLAELAGRPYVQVSQEGDGLPPFRPG